MITTIFEGLRHVSNLCQSDKPCSLTRHIFQSSLTDLRISNPKLCQNIDMNPVEIRTFQGCLSKLLDNRAGTMFRGRAAGGGEFFLSLELTYRSSD